MTGSCSSNKLNGYVLRKNGTDSDDDSDDNSMGKKGDIGEVHNVLKFS